MSDGALLAELVAEVRALRRLVESGAAARWSEWLTLTQLAAYLGGLSPCTVRQLVHRGRLPQPRQVPSFDRAGRPLRAIKALYRRADVDAHVGGKLVNGKCGGGWKVGIPAARGRAARIGAVGT